MLGHNGQGKPQETRNYLSTKIHGFVRKGRRKDLSVHERVWEGMEMRSSWGMRERVKTNKNSWSSFSGRCGTCWVVEFVPYRRS